MDELEEVIHYFGYAKSDNNPFSFYDYKGKAKPYSIKHLNWF